MFETAAAFGLSESSNERFSPPARPPGQPDPIANRAELAGLAGPTKGPISLGNKKPASIEQHLLVFDCGREISLPLDHFGD